MRRTLLTSLCAVSVAAAQIVSSNIVGSVTDATGAMVPGVNLIVTNQSTGVARTATTGPDGAFVFPQLAPGTYTITASAQGFKKYEAAGLVLPVNQTLRSDVRLTVGDVAEQVRVEASGLRVESETSSLGQVIEQKNIVDLPLNGRNFMQLANLSSGVVPAYNNRSATIANQSGRTDMAVHISGGRGDTNSYLVDGVETRSSWFNSPSVMLSVDAI